MGDKGELPLLEKGALLHASGSETLAELVPDGLVEAGWNRFIRRALRSGNPSGQRDRRQDPSRTGCPLFRQHFREGIAR